MCPQLQEYLTVFICPACRSELRLKSGQLRCCGAGHLFSIQDSIPQLFVPNEWEGGRLDVTDTVREFYERTPFPNYDTFDSIAALIQKSKRGRFARLLDEQIPLGAKVLEMGCGTGQLSNFLGIAQRQVFGADMCLHSLRLAETFRERNELSRVGFYQMNLFRPIFKEETFDLVIANGVLHHTSDPFGAFKSIAPLVKKGGYILVGLYNTFGRLMTDLRRVVFRSTGNRFLSLDPYLRERGRIDPKTEAWFADQYRHPHESTHTMGEVLRWFDEADYDFVNSIPKGSFLKPFTDRERLFAPTPPAAWHTLLAVQAHMILSGSREGGLFIMIGQRKLAGH